MLGATGGAGAMAFGMTMFLTDNFTQAANNISQTLARLDAQADRYSSRTMSNMQRSVNTIQSGVAQMFYGATLSAPFAVAIEKAGEYQMSLIRLEDLLGDAAKAQMALGLIEQDALKFPALGTQDLLKANASILQVNNNFQEVRQTVNDLALSLMRSGQTGSLAFQRMTNNLVQLFSRQTLTFGEIKQYANAGLPIIRALNQLKIKWGEGIKVSVEDTLRALKLMAGGEDILKRIENSAAGASAQLKELAEMALTKFGLAIEGMFVDFSKSLGGFLKDLRAFFETSIGKGVAKLLVLITVFISLGIILMGLIRIFAGFKNLFISSFNFMFKDKSFASLLKSLGRMSMALWLIPKLLETNSMALNKLAAVVAVVSGKFGIFLYVVTSLMRAWKDFGKFMQDGIMPTSEIGKQFVWLGGILQGLMEFFNTWDGESFQFSTKMEKALRDSGAMDFLLNMIYIIKSLAWAINILAEAVGFLAENKWVLGMVASFYVLYRFLQILISLLTLFNIQTIITGQSVGVALSRMIAWVFGVMLQGAISLGWLNMAAWLNWLETAFLGGWLNAFRTIGGAFVTFLSSMASSFIGWFVPTIVSGLTSIGTAMGLAFAPIWLVAIIVIAIIAIIVGLVYLIYTYWEDIVEVIKIVGNIIWNVILAPFKAFVALFEYLMGMSNSGNYSFPEAPEGQQLYDYSSPDGGTTGSIMSPMIENKYGGSRRDNLGGGQGGLNGLEASVQPFIIELDGEVIYRNMQERNRFASARNSSGIPS